MTSVPRPERRFPEEYRSSSLRAPRWIDSAEVSSELTPRRAVDALKRHLDSGFRPEDDAARTRVDTSAGTLLQMPSTVDLPGRGTFVGTKLLTITPGNAVWSEPVIQGVYQLFGGPHQGPLATIDGASLTAVRTPAVSALGVELLLGEEAAHLDLLIVGTGVQAWEHARTFAALFPLDRIWVAGRSLGKAETLARRISSELGVESAAVSLGGRAMEGAVAEADLIVTCTSSATPVVEGETVKAGAVVVAVGSHDPSARELDDALMARAEILVESRATAVAEAGEIVQALESGALVSQYCLTTLSEAAFYRRADAERPAVFKTTGMGWQDLALAIELVSPGEEVEPVLTDPLGI
jgi:ornithine cyclodeaminase